MYNDSIETLLLRHYGNTAPAPQTLEQQLMCSLQHEMREQRWQQRLARRFRVQRINRRKAVRLVAIGSAGLGLLSIGMESLHALEEALRGQDNTQPALS